jgi:hypothetical protein
MAKGVLLREPNKTKPLNFEFSGFVSLCEAAGVRTDRVF